MHNNYHNRGWIADDCRNNRWSVKGTHEESHTETTIIPWSMLNTRPVPCPPITKQWNFASAKAAIFAWCKCTLHCIHKSRDIQSGTTMSGHSKPIIDFLIWPTILRRKDVKRRQTYVYTSLSYTQRHFVNSKRSYIATTSTNLFFFIHIILHVLYLTSWYDFILFTWNILKILWLK